MRPEWHQCFFCYFALLGTDNGWWCHFDQIPTETTENSFCSKWLCNSCGGSWYSEESHIECIDITVELN